MRTHVTQVCYSNEKKNLSKITRVRALSLILYGGVRAPQMRNTHPLCHLPLRGATAVRAVQKGEMRTPVTQVGYSNERKNLSQSNPSPSSYGGVRAVLRKCEIPIHCTIFQRFACQQALFPPNRDKIATAGNDGCSCGSQGTCENTCDSSWLFK